MHDSVEALKAVLGHKISPEAEWPALWRELQTRFSEKGHFVPTIVRYASAWYETLLARVDDATYETWTDELLSALSDASASLKLQIEVRPAHALTIPPLTALFTNDLALCAKCYSSFNAIPQAVWHIFPLHPANRDRIQQPASQHLSQGL